MLLLLLALLTHVLAETLRFDLGVALVTEGAALVLHKAQIRQLLVTHLAAEALGVPSGIHGLDDTADNELA